MPESHDDPRECMPGRQQRTDPAQMGFEWRPPSVRNDDRKGEAVTLSKVPHAGASPPAVVRTSRKLGAKSPALLTNKRPFWEVVERYLRERGIPYINVDEAKKALFAGAKLRSFHFVVYFSDKKNWLLHTAQMRKEIRQDLKQWEQIFGDGFMAVVAKGASDGTPKFQKLDGEPLEI